MVHKHGYLTKPMPVYLPNEQKLAFLLPTISVTSGKIQMFFPMYGYSQPLKNRRAIQLMPLPNRLQNYIRHRVRREELFLPP
jgi:hypothetical protein